MGLKIKTTYWSAGLPVAMIRREIAQKFGIHAGDRIKIKTRSKNPKEMATIVDIVKVLLKKDEIAVTKQIKKRLNLREGQKVDIELTQTPESVLFIKEKLIGKKLNKEKINAIIKGVVENSLSEPEVAMFVSGMYKNGMDFQETVALINAILYTGNRLKFKNKYVVDKHCIGGIAGNRTTPLVVAICAAGGLTFPKTSSRAITSAAGTADCIEVLSPVEYSVEKLQKIVKKTGACLTWGGSIGMVPADSKIIKVEKMLKLDPEAQLLASIMSKKLAAGSKYILIDIPYGKQAKVSKKRAKKLKKKFERLGKHFKVKVKLVLTKATEPIGNGVGPALEIIDIIKILDPKLVGPKDLEEKSIYLSGILFELCKKTKKGKGEIYAKELLLSGGAYKKFIEIIKAQKGKVKIPKLGKYSFTFFAEKKGKVLGIHNKNINRLARVAGCPIDKFSGVYLHKHIRDKFEKGDRLLTIYAESNSRLKEAKKFYQKTRPLTLNYFTKLKKYLGK